MKLMNWMNSSELLFHLNWVVYGIITSLLGHSLFSCSVGPSTCTLVVRFLSFPALRDVLTSHLVDVTSRRSVLAYFCSFTTLTLHLIPLLSSLSTCLPLYSHGAHRSSSSTLLSVALCLSTSILSRRSTLAPRHGLSRRSAFV